MAALALSAAAPAADPSDPYVREAMARDLAHSREWLRLGHYTPDLIGSGYGSQADGMNFFLSPLGKGDPQEELVATIRAFFSTAPHSKEKPHPQCTFPARLRFLRRELKFRDAELPQVQCPEFQDFAKRMDPESVTVVFSSYYLDSAASTFGHTFIRLNRKHSQFDEKRYELLDTGINYAAVVTVTNPVLYPLMGFIGFFKGTFTAVPYYYKVREYNDFESRDLWGYDLNLTREEIDQLVAHLWELGSTYFDYYFLTENCSYHVLTAIEAAAPRLDLTSRLPWYVIPASTIKTLASTPGLVSGVHYRPSVRSMFEHRLSLLDAQQRQELRRAVDTRQVADLGTTLGPERAAGVLDAAMDYEEFASPESLINVPDQADKAKVAATEIRREDAWKHELLVRRAQLRVRSPDLKIPEPVDRLPHITHPERRLGAGYGTFGDGSRFADVSLRMAMHDPLDPSEGYPDTMDIEMLSLAARYDLAGRVFNLQDLTLFQIGTFSPLQEFIHHRSFRAKLALERVDDENCDHCLAGRIQLGVGASVQPLEPMTLYGFVEGELATSTGFSASNFRVGMGPALGFLVRASSHLSLQAETHYRYLTLSAKPHDYGAKAEVRWEFAHNLGLNVQALRLTRDLEGAGGLYFYF